MEIESARALKSEVIEQIIGPAIRDTRHARRFALSARMTERRTSVLPSIAVGIGGVGVGSQYKLAVRIQSRLLDLEQKLRSDIESRARGEAEIRYIGDVKKAAGVGTSPWQRRRHRPLLCGVSVSHFDVTVGTLGCFVIDPKLNKPAILSNNHVLANEDRGKIGDAVVQPGSYDKGNKARDRIGQLLRSIPLKTGGTNFIDAAVAVLDSKIRFDATTLTGLGILQGFRKDQIEPGDTVAKIGRTTGLTHGIVTAIELDEVIVSYDCGALKFNGQIEIEGAGSSPFSDGGDSGSLIVDKECRGCALLFAGSDQGGSNGKGLTYGNDLKLVLNSLKLELQAEAPPGEV